VLFRPGTLTAFQSRLMTAQGQLVNQFKIGLPALVRFVMHQDELTGKAREELFKALQAKTLKKGT
jgi:ABC-type tungstate transport system substrate-binding protein